MSYPRRAMALLVLAGLVGAMLLAAAGCAGDDGSDKEPIVFSDLNWDSAQLQNKIAMYIVEHGYGYPVDTVFGDTISLWTGLLNNDTQVYMEAWLPNMQDIWDKAIADGAVIPVGKSLDDNWQSMFVIPTYVQEANPGLVSVDDLPDYQDLFATADTKGKARLVTCIPGWACEIVNASKVEAYGLEDVVELANPGTTAGLFADLEGAYERGDPWLGYMWGPTKVAADLDLTTLEEPDCPAGQGPETGCAYPTSEVLIAVHPSLETRAPDVIQFFRKWDFTAASQVATSGWMAENEATTDEAAIWYLENQRDVWKAFVPEDVAKKVDEALAG